MHSGPDTWCALPYRTFSVFLHLGSATDSAEIHPLLCTQSGTGFQLPPLLSMWICTSLSLGFLICKMEIATPLSWGEQEDPHAWCSAWHVGGV
jgi:hypothetical protein